MATDRRPCTCENAYQDAKYGKGMRVMNSTSHPDRWRCTSCGQESGSGVTKKK